MVTSSKIFVESDSVWYCNALVGEKKLSTFFSCLSKAAGFSQIYTNYSIRATGSSILLTSMVGPSQAIAVTRHKSVQKCMSKRQWRENYNNDGRLIYRKHSTYNGRFTKLKNPAIKPAVRTENNDFHEIQNVNLDLTNINMNALLSDFGGQEFICTQLLISDLQPVSMFRNWFITIHNLKNRWRIFTRKAQLCNFLNIVELLTFHFLIAFYKRL